MFAGFAKVWSAVAPAADLGQKPLAVELAGERLVLFRDRDGRPAALHDQCPHRGVRLSLGKVTAEGCLSCPFHGWEFAPDGKACHVPLNPEARRERLSARAFAVREVGGILFVFTGDPAGELPPLMLPESLTREDLTRTFHTVEWNAHWTRAMENMLDSPHVPFVHRTTIGRSQSARMTRESAMQVEWEATAYGGRTTSTMDGRDEGAWLDFYAPNMMVLHIPIPGKVFRMHSIAIPLIGNRVRMLIVGARSFARPAILNPFFNRSNAVIAAQDRAVVESSAPPVVPPPAEEVSVRTDRATLQFRRYYYRELHDRSYEPRGAEASDGRLRQVDAVNPDSQQ